MILESFKSEKILFILKLSFNMEIPKYNGNTHPEEWLKQVQTHCYLKGIENETQILKICKLMIDSTIIIPKEINSFDELNKSLKSHTTFTIFKNSCKKKLLLMKYIPGKEENYTASFLANFRSLCSYAEINDPDELKTLLVNSYSNDFFKIEFTKRVDNINLKESPYYIDEIVKLFNEVVLDELKVIKYDSLIALKHVTTGRYLSSYDINYKTGSQRKMVSNFFFFFLDIKIQLIIILIINFLSLFLGICW